MSNGLKVAVIGASGIGQHHARWHHLSGSQVVAFAGTSKETCAKTRSLLQADFGFDGRAYTDVARMLKAEQPDVVDVSSPPHLHKDHAILALQSGCHVVCEKPLCWDEDKGLDAILDDGRAVVDAAKQAGKSLAMSAQYAAAIPMYRQLYTRARGAWDRVDSVEMVMESKGRRGPKAREEIWIDLASHPLSLVFGFLPDGEIDWSSAACEIGERENRARFDVLTPKGRCAVQFALRDRDEGVPIRQFGVNGFLVNWEGFADEEGIYRARLSADGETATCPDFMHIFIGEFAEHIRGTGGQVIVSGADALKNLQAQIALLKRADRRV